MWLHPGTIKPAKGAKKVSKRVGRGNASGKGTYSGRGGKGQTARSGGKSRTQMRGFRSALLKIPKLRGFKSPYAKKEIVALSALERIAEPGDVITPAVLKAKGIINYPERGVKILADGNLTKPLKIEGCFASRKAIEAVKKAGGEVKV